jgi:hypothetical protein
MNLQRLSAKRHRKFIELAWGAFFTALRIFITRARLDTIVFMKNSNADPGAEKRDAYRAATELLSGQDGGPALRYAALELRRCIEAIVYEKLVVYGPLLPEGSVSSWQPPQAFDPLIAIEPNAEETLTIAVGLQIEPGVMSPGPYTRIGVDERPRGKWIKKTWHRLGSRLHAEWPFENSKKPRVPSRAFLDETLKALAPFVRNSFTAVVTDSIGFTCAGCGLEAKTLAKAVESKREAICFSCGVRYRAEKAGNSFTFFPNEPGFRCECGAEGLIPTGRIKISYQFSCRACSRTIEFVGFDWRYQFLDAAHASQVPEEA